jgi:hypothetical protein
MKNNVRRTLRPNLEALEDRLVPAVDAFIWFSQAAVLTGPQPALSSFQWGIGRGIASAAKVGLTTPTGPTTVVDGAPAAKAKFNDFMKVTFGDVLTMPDGPTTVVEGAAAAKAKFNDFLKVNKFADVLTMSAGDTSAISELVRLRRIVGFSTVVVTGAPGHVQSDEFTITKPTDSASPTESISLNFTKITIS